MGNLSVADGPNQQSPAQANFQLDNNQEAFPALQAAGAAGEQWYSRDMRKYANHVLITTPAGNTSPLGVGRRNGSSRPQSRPTSRHQQRDLNPSPLSVDDPEAFPALSAMAAKGSGKKHHGKRGGHNNKETVASSLADVVRIASPGPGKGKNAKAGKEVKTRELSAAALAIPAPQNIPWLETGPRANQLYIKYRTDAIRHGTVRNKFLQRLVDLL
jgi:hypothetical protein